MTTLNLFTYRQIQMMKWTMQTLETNLIAKEVCRKIPNTKNEMNNQSGDENMHIKLNKYPSYPH